MRKFTLPAALIGLLAAVTGYCQTARTGPEWPCFHGPRRNNTSTETGLLKKWPDGGPKRLWTASGLGKGYSTVSISGGRIFTAGSIDNQTHVFALDMDGKMLWRKLNGPSWSTTQRWAAGYDGARSTPTCDGGRVYHLGEMGRLTAFDAATGAEAWSFNVLERFEGKPAAYGLAESVLIDGDRLICSPAAAKGFIVCLNKADGKTIWANADIPGGAAYSSAVIAEFGGFRQVLGMSSTVVYGVDIETGKLLWSVPHGNQRNNTATDPVFHDGCVYASSGYGKGSVGVKLSAADGGIRAEEVWRSRRMDNHHGGVVRVGDHLYGAGHNDPGWSCLAARTGEVAWNVPGKGSLTAADGMLYCLDEKGTMSLVEATPEAYRRVSSFTVPSGGAGLHWAHPVVCGGRVYVRHADKLFAYDIRAD